MDKTYSNQQDTDHLSDNEVSSPCESILGYPVCVKPREWCISEIYGWLKDSQRKGRYFVCINPHSIEVARKDSIFHDAIQKADLTIPDGIGVVIASRILGGSIRERVTGSDIFLGLSHMANRDGGCRYFLLGSTDEELRIIEEKIRRDFSHIDIAGSYSPPFKNEFSEQDNKIMVERINAARADVLWVGMTAPKQEKWIYTNRSRLSVKVIGPVGAVFNFYTGTVKRSNPWFQKHGLEWLPRLIKQPGHLWRRNLVSNPLFMARILNLRISKKGPR